MNWDSHILTGWTGVAVLAAPALVFAALNFLSDAPMEWGRGALMAWLCVCAVLVAGVSAPALGPAAVLLVAVLSFVTLMIGGTTGLVLAVVIVAGVAAGVLATGGGAVHVAAAPVLAGLGAVAALRHLFG